MTALLIGIAGLFFSAFTFLMGRIFAQSEMVLAEKRRVYEEFLSICPTPNDAYQEWSAELEMERMVELRPIQGVLSLYASPTVALALGRYFQVFDEADKVLSPASEALHPKFKELAKAQNDLILEMRRDALGWSVFGYRGQSRLPEKALEEAKRNSL